jgi:hypothetical protein
MLNETKYVFLLGTIILHLIPGKQCFKGNKYRVAQKFLIVFFYMYTYKFAPFSVCAGLSS